MKRNLLVHNNIRLDLTSGDVRVNNKHVCKLRIGSRQYRFLSIYLRTKGKANVELLISQTTTNPFRVKIPITTQEEKAKLDLLASKLRRKGIPLPFKIKRPS